MSINHSSSYYRKHHGDLNLPPPIAIPISQNPTSSSKPNTNYNNEPEYHAYTLNSTNGNVKPSYPVAVASSVPDNSIPEESFTDRKMNQLYSQGFLKGMAKDLHRNTLEFPLRIWVVDNSGSMAKSDGHRFIETANSQDVKVVSCSRWAEIQETVVYHAEIAALLQAPTIFRLLNPSGGVQQLCIAGKGTEMIAQELRRAKDAIMKMSPAGTTPLSRHVREITSIVQDMAPALETEGKRVAIVLATDGLPSDNQGRSGKHEQDEFIASLRNLEGLPIWIVVRLCTDDDAVVEFYNELDAQLELSVEVLDDFESEAKEIYQHNKWLNYTLPIHRARELGYHHRLFDLLDERLLTRDELRNFCFLMFGADVFDGVPDSETDWDGFFKAISDIVVKENKQWNPLKRRRRKVIDLKALHYMYGKPWACNII